MQIERYQGTPDAPTPPTPAGWRDLPIPYSDEGRRQRASGLLGALPPWSYVDEPAAGGVTRYFAYEHPLGRAVGALWLEPAAATSTLGAQPTTDEQLAAVAMNNALIAHGYKLADQDLYFAFQDTQPTITSDGFPGTETMRALKDVLFQIGVEIAPVPVYPWLSRPGTSGYDGVNAPLLSEWDPGGGGGGGGGGGHTTPEPVPAPDASCTHWVADASNPAAVTMADGIAHRDTPTKWIDQGTFDSTIGGVRYRFVMWYEAGLKTVAAYRCAAGPGASQASVAGGGGAVAAVVAGVAIVAGIIATAVAAKHPIRF